MPTFRTVTVHLPQCSRCSAAALGPDGEQPALEREHLGDDLVRHLATVGWKVVTPKRLRIGGTTGFHLTCPRCATNEAAWAKWHHEQLHRPLVVTVDMADKLGPGWVLGQRDDADASTYRWLVVDGTGRVAGLVRRYQLRGGKAGFSRGWECLVSLGGTVLSQQYATKAASYSDRSSFLWRTRDLAAWGVVARPDFEAPSPAWAGRRRS